MVKDRKQTQCLAQLLIMPIVSSRKQNTKGKQTTTAVRRYQTVPFMTVQIKKYPFSFKKFRRKSKSEKEQIRLSKEKETV
ncbi:hypothetical protein CEXT_459601 [Caerostris extrusa]|uniref:Ribosomal protein S18 n=1 Tax=Caerostris extrusa TaxID=172846 RepID=A0AAV4QWN0_CAEEX|nr:hypothetical protein CEXT_459601 [Caerostris extrusa]